MNEQITLQAAGPQDRAFLFSVYASTRVEELAGLDWSVEQKIAFLQQQFHAQDVYYHDNYDPEQTSYAIIVVDGAPAGRLYINRLPDEIHIIDIAVLPQFRNRGIGTNLLKELLAEGVATGKKVSIYVERFNPAQQLYARLGFVPGAEFGVYFQMSWTPPSAAPIT